MKSFVVDFNNVSDFKEKIDSLILQIPEKKILWGLIKQEVNLNYHSVRIDNIYLDDKIVINNLDDFITLTINTPSQRISSNHLQDINMTVNELEILIELDKKQIVDLLSENYYKKEISFDVIAKPNEESGELVKNFIFELVFIKANSEFKISFHKDDIFYSGLEHRKDLEVFFGNLEIFCESQFNFAFPIENCNLSIINNKEINEGIYFAEKQKIVAHDYSTGLYRELSITDNQNSLQFQKIEPRTKITVPVFLNLNKIENPDEVKNFKGKFSLAYQKQGNEAIKSEDFEFNILPDTRSTSLFVMLDDGSGYRKMDSGLHFLNSKYQWLGNDARGKSTCFSLKIGNSAENGNGKVEIKNLKIRFNHSEDSTSPLITESYDRTTNKDFSLYDKCLADIFTINNNSQDHLIQDFIFKNDINSFQEFIVGFRFDSIFDIPNDISQIECKLSFNYTITDNEIHGEESSFESIIVFKIEKNLGDHWLAIDYGTSAIVTAFADGDALARYKINNLILDLQQTLNSYNPTSGENMSENGTKFLSSEMLIRDSKRENPVYMESTNYHDDVVQLSPSKDELAQYSFRSVPYLKSLIGGETVPDFSGKLQDIQYAEKPNSPLVSFKDNPIKIESILSNTYNIIVRDFVEKNIAENKKLNKVILTIPNTFTPKHIDSIRNVFLTKFQNFKPDYIDFISESDAVACHYISNWEMMNRDRIDTSSFANNDEYVLVYDIGAGTTDITYLRISKIANGEKELTILGKFGKTTAGNYLDYTIAEIISVLLQEKYINQDNYSIDETRLAKLPNFLVKEKIRVDSVDVYDAKQVIKDTIKASLTENTVFKITENGFIRTNVESDFEVTTDEIVNHSIMKRFLFENSHDLFDKFFGLFNKLEVGSSETLQKGEFPLHTVIFTGRSAQFQKLRFAVEEELIGWTKSPEQIHYINNLDADELKNTVVLGALQYAMVYRNQHNSPVKITNRNIYARYGFLYKDFESGRWVFKELLNPSTKPLNSTPHRVDGITIYEYDSGVFNALEYGDSATIDLRNSSTGYFVQSFSSNTAQDVNEHNWQYVTVMFHFSRDMVSGGGNSAYVPVRVIVNAKNEMIVRVGSYENDPQAPLKIDLADNETFKKSMWPFIV